MRVHYSLLNVRETLISLAGREYLVLSAINYWLSEDIGRDKLMRVFYTAKGYWIAATCRNRRHYSLSKGFPWTAHAKR